MNPNTTTEYRDLPLAVLTESATNPRRIFEDAALKELADYVSRAHNPPFVPVSVLWPWQRDVALQKAVRVLKGT